MTHKKPLVIKIGSAVLTDVTGLIDETVMGRLVDDMAHMIARRQPICLVSSGAIGAGRQVLGTARMPRKLKKRQALAAIGQVRLMGIYQREFARHGLSIGQILLSHEDLAHRRSFLNTRSTVEQLFELGVVPIVNENDTVSTEEIQFGDNDRLSVLMANVVGAERAIFLSTTPGLLDLGGTGELISEVANIDADILGMARGGNNVGSGGMGSKLLSIGALTRAGKTAWLMHGKEVGILKRWFEGEKVGTCFLPQALKKSSREQWMEQHLHPRGKLLVDEGACVALKNSASLLSVGIQDVRGRFDAGQLVSVECQGEEFARGLVRFSHEQIKSILGKSKADMAKILGVKTSECVIHRNDLVRLDPEGAH
jgi:glutamate 5-kinase